MQGGQLAGALQLSKGSGLLLGLAVGVEQFGLNARQAVGDQLQRQGFDTGGMAAAEHVEDAHQRLSQLPANT